MNIFDKEVLLSLKEKQFSSQRALAKQLDLSLGTINHSINSLKAQDYINDDYEILSKAEALFRKNKPKSAIILAAGYGMRMVPINSEVPKGLLKIKNEPLIERIIKQLHEVSITDISIVVGFMKEKYDYLIDEYGVKLICNNSYQTKNNLHSLCLIKDKISNSYIIPCDVWCADNPFHTDELYSWYMITKEKSRKSMIRLNRKKELVLTEETEEKNKMIGISYITAEDADYIKNNLLLMDKQPRYDNCYWEEVLIKNGKLLPAAKIAPASQVVEIDTYEQLRELDSNSDHLRIEAIEIIKNALNVNNKDIREIKVLKKGMTNRSFLFTVNDESYIMRIPGEGTDQLINRKEEADIYKKIDPYHLCDPIIYINPENGYKITKFYNNSRVCDPNNLGDLQKCVSFLRKFHKLNLKVDHTFDLFGKIDFYEQLWDDQPSIFKDYAQTKENILSLKSFIDSCGKDWCLTHIDAVPDNFLFLENGDIKLIDWEYAGMQDPHVDIAMFCIYSLFDPDQVDQFIDLYFDNHCPEVTRTKIYAYIAICGLLWSNWCEYKRNLGVEFGEYSLAQYRYAKEYYKKAKHRLGGQQCTK